VGLSKWYYLRIEIINDQSKTIGKVGTRGGPVAVMLTVRVSHTLLSLPYQPPKEAQNIVEASIADLQDALTAGTITSVDLVAKYLLRIHTYDFRGPCLNSIVKLNPEAFREAEASDQRRANGNARGPLEGIPYTLKDSMKYKGMTCSSGSPAFANLIAREDSFVAEQLRKAGAVCMGSTNTPPMMASGMHRGLYGRAESPYNLEYLTAAFSSGSSNGSATSTAASFAAFGLGSETVSSGRSPASNNALVAYTGSRDVISPRGVWPLYPTCDVLVPQTRTVEDMLRVLDCLAVKDDRDHENFWKQQQYVTIEDVKRPESFLELLNGCDNALKGKRLAVPKMFIGGDDPKAKPTFVSEEVIALWKEAQKTLEAFGATVVETDFPLVSNYEDDSVSGHTNNVVGFQPDWNGKERGELVAYLWDDFLKSNGDPNYPDLASADGSQMFPRPGEYIPDRYMEQKNFMNYPGLVDRARERNGKSIWEIEDIAEALPALEAQRKRDLEDWMASHKIDAVVFPANGGVGKADLEYDDASAKHALQNGVKYSNGNRAIRHMGVPTVSTTMGLMAEKKMPCNLTFVGKHGQDCELLQFAQAFEQATERRAKPPVTPELPTDAVGATSGKVASGNGGHAPPKLSIMSSYMEGKTLYMSGTLNTAQDGVDTELQVFLDGTQVSPVKEGFAWSIATGIEPFTPETPLYGGYGVHVGKVNVVVIARGKGGVTGEVVSVNL
jgi:Asp-tRNA(Asn)/Glu-tRNA(Gln) amidotransferase A subunit family amidase